MVKYPNKTGSKCPKCNKKPTSGEADRFVCDRHDETVVWGYGA